MSATTRRQRTVLHGEQLEAAIQELNEFAAQQAVDIRAKNRGRVYRSSPNKPDIDALLDETLRAALEDEIIPAVESRDTVIMEGEFDQEVIKKALAGLHAEALHRIARSTVLDASGGIEELATRIGRYYRWNREQIAQLILENEPEPTEEQGHVERLFPLDEAADLGVVGERLGYVLGRYIRTGIARWFVFEKLESDEDRVILGGTLRAYAATISRELDVPSVVAVPRTEHAIEIEINESRLLHVRHGNAFESSAAVTALAAVTDLKPSGYVPIVATGVKGQAALLAPESLFMLDLLTTRFARAGLHSRNITVARFHMDARDDSTAPAPVSKPRLKAVRFEGAHLLDSSPACKLLADEGRALVDVSLTVESPPRPDGESGRFPIRVALERDHVLALTGFGAIPGLSFTVHAQLVEAVRRELLEGLADPVGLTTFAVRIKERARLTQPVEKADMVADESDDEAV